MISHHHRVIFIHIPKTAGTSIEAAFGHHGDAGVVRDVQDHRTLRQLQWPHSRRGVASSTENVAEALRAVKARLRPPAHVANRARVDRQQYASYLKLGVVRDPWDRTWSWYRNVVGDPLHRERLGIDADAGFGELVARHLGRDMLRPQLYWLRSFDRPVGVDVVCRYENLAVDFAEACRGLEHPPADLPHLGGGGAAAPYPDAYDDATRRLVADFFAEEIALFDYRFGVTTSSS